MPVLTTDNAKILYIHVPKTGGTYVEELLRSYGQLTGVHYNTDVHDFPCSPQHFHSSLYQPIYFSEGIRETNPFDFVFMTVRNPYTRLISEYHRRDRTLFAEDDSVENLNEWCKTVLTLMKFQPYYLDNHLRPQWEFQPTCCETTIYKQEKGFDKLANKLSELIELFPERDNKRLNVSRVVFKKKHLYNTTKKLVAETYAEDFRRFRYVV